MRTSRAHAPFITCGRWNDHPWRSVCGAPTLICIVIVALNVGSVAGSISAGHCGRRTRYPHRRSPDMWITRPLLCHIHCRRLLVKNYSKTKAFFREIKKRPTRGGSLSQVQRGRISAQPHRCNGKSFQCPPNVIILLIIYFCGSALRLSLYLQLCSEFRITQIEIAHASQSEHMCSFYLFVFISTKILTERIAYSVHFSQLDVQSLKYSDNVSACRSPLAENLTFPLSLCVKRDSTARRYVSFYAKEAPSSGFPLSLSLCPLSALPLRKKRQTGPPICPLLRRRGLRRGGFYARELTQRRFTQRRFTQRGAHWHTAHHHNPTTHPTAQFGTAKRAHL